MNKAGLEIIEQLSENYILMLKGFDISDLRACFITPPPRNVDFKTYKKLGVFFYKVTGTTFVRINDNSVRYRIDWVGPRIAGH